MDAIILAAGTGSRLLNLTREGPKALVKVHGHQLLEHALSFVNLCKCQRVLVVGGFYFEQMKEHVKRRENITLLENSDFLKGSILTLAKALPIAEDSFLLMNVDHIYPGRLARKITAEVDRLSTVTAIVDFDRPLHEDDMKVLIDGKRHIRRISKTLSEFDAGYIGMTYVPKPALPLYKAAIEQVALLDEKNNVEKALQFLADDGTPPSTLDASGIRWLEVDNQTDLMNSERILRNLPDFLA